MVGKFVEFFGPGVSLLSIADRATISNMCPEYGATVGFFPVDESSLTYLNQTGRSDETVNHIRAYLEKARLSNLRFSKNFCDNFKIIENSNRTYRAKR